VSQKPVKPQQVAPPSATANAGPQFEVKVGAFYLLALIAESEPRGLPGATIRTIKFQQRVTGHPLDDVVIEATNADGSPACLEIQAKRSLTFTASDSEFEDVVAQMWEASQKPEFQSSRYELAVAIARTTTRVEHVCQEVLHWARELPDGASFAAHINREKFASNGMRNFVEVIRANLAKTSAPTDDETVWRLLRRFQILVFDFESPGSDYEHRARERARSVLAPDHLHRAADLWPIIIEHASACARAGGARARLAVVTPLGQQHGLRFTQPVDLRPVEARLTEAASHALAEINDQVGGVRLARTELIDNASAALDQHRVLHIVGAPGVGKSWVMKHLAQRLQPEGRIIALRHGRIIPGGWLAMAHAIGCTVSREELYNELGCGGGATLFIDNIDQIDDDGEWATVRDLLGCVAKAPGWRAVVTGGVGNDDWKTRLPPELVKAGIVTLQVEPISDDETTVLSEGNYALAIILSSGHPASSIARNLFYLSRMIELGAGHADAATGIASEMDLARLWWRYGGGRAEDDGRFARLKALRAMGMQVLEQPGRVSFKADDLGSASVVELLRFDSLREDVKGATVAFRHDVLRDWTVGFLIHDDKDLLAALPMDKPVSIGLARGVEIAARLAIETDGSGAAWLAMVAAVGRDQVHGSWKRPVLLALPRSEKALAQFLGLESALLEDHGRRLSEIIRLMIAVESEGLKSAVARLGLAITLPAGVGDMTILKGPNWMWLVTWMVARAKLLPPEVIPDAAKVFRGWLMATSAQPQCAALNAGIVQLLFEWLALLEEELTPRMFKNMSEVPPPLNVPHPRAVRDDIRLTFVTFCNLNPALAKAYLAGRNPDEMQHHDLQDLLRAPGNLVKSAPAEFTTFMLGALIEEPDEDDFHGRSRRRYAATGLHDYLFSPASPGQGPFLELLEADAGEGLRLVRGLVENATEIRRSQYGEARASFPRINIPFPDGTKSFEGDYSVYYWPRSGPSVVVTSALMALEAWAHRQVEGGRPFDQVLHDVLGPDGSSLAFLSVAVDLVLSHWKLARDSARPLVATPELLQFDDQRFKRDITGVDRMLAFETERDGLPMKRAELDAKPSRRKRLSDTIGDYVFRAPADQLASLRDTLEQARNEINQKPNDEDDSIECLRAVANRALRMTFAEHWPLVKIRTESGEEVEVRQFERDPEETRKIEAEAARIEASTRHHTTRSKIQAALFDKAKSTPEIVAEGIRWAKEQQAKTSETAASDEEGEDQNFSAEQDSRAVVMAAALAMRDYENADRTNVIGWAMHVLDAAAFESQKEYRGNDQVEYNAAAIAGLGLVEAYRRDLDVATREKILRLAANPHKSVLRAITTNFSDLANHDDRLPRSMTRVCMTAAIHPHRTDNDRRQEENLAGYRARVEAAIAAECRWLDGKGPEPPWPELPSWLSRARRGIKLGDWAAADEDDDDDVVPEEYLDDHALGVMLSHLIALTVGPLRLWLVDLAQHLMDWSGEANGPHGEDDRERDNRPYTWNHHFFEFAGILGVALPHAWLIDFFVTPMTRFKDEAFHDVMATFLRGFDRATLAIDTHKPENAPEVRSLLAERIRTGWNYRRLGREKGFTSETHAGDALNAMFYQEHRASNTGKPYIPANWAGLPSTMAILTALTAGAPSSGYIATLFLNLVESSSTVPLVPHVAEAMAAWSSAYGAEPNFWSENGIGTRVCAWLNRALTGSDGRPVRLDDPTRDSLLKSLDVLVRAGIAQAKEIEERVSESDEARKSA
jgi:hypothetical protein